jgi:ABC-type Zn2+ transport system substrate-binding protein/surface adhesin
VLNAVVQARPQHEADFRNAFESLESDLTELDSQLQEMSEQLGKQPVLFSHPVYQYLERRYNLRGFSVHWEPDEVPEEAQWRQLQSVLSPWRKRVAGCWTSALTVSSSLPVVTGRQGATCSTLCMRGLLH